jgi:ferredoxin
VVSPAPVPSSRTVAPAAPAPPSDPLTAYYRNVRQGNWQLARERYKDEGVKVRTQEYIRGRGTTAIIEPEVCMGCMHCFDNCAFEAITANDRKFSLPDYSYTSRKAVIVVENCVGCEKCAIVCPVDAITMIPKFGWEVRDGKLVQTDAPPPAPRPATAPAAPRPATTPAPSPARPTTPAPAPPSPPGGI